MYIFLSTLTKRVPRFSCETSPGSYSETGAAPWWCIQRCPLISSVPHNRCCVTKEHPPLLPAPLSILNISDPRKEPGKWHTQTHFHILNLIKLISTSPHRGTIIVVPAPLSNKIYRQDSIYQNADALGLPGGVLEDRTDAQGCQLMVKGFTVTFSRHIWNESTFMWDVSLCSNRRDRHRNMQCDMWFAL